MAMTTKEFNEALAALRLSVYAAAPILGISLRQAQRYSAGDPVAAPVANYLTLQVQMIHRWKSELKKTRDMIAMATEKGFTARKDGRDVTDGWLQTLRNQETRWERLLRDPGNGLPAQIGPV